MDQSLDEILAERQQSFRDRDDTPRNLDTEWVHDRYDDNGGGRLDFPRGRGVADRNSDSRGTKIRVDNIHYDLTEEELHGLFRSIGPVSRLELRYDRAGRSEGVAFVTYESHRDALDAIREFDGANAAGQPIHLKIVPSGPETRSRNPFDTAIAPGRPLAERITVPGERARSFSPGRRDTGDDGPSRRRDDRYRPAGSRSPMPRRPREAGRRPGARHEGGGRGGERGGARGGERSGRDGRPKKTQEELDAEMDNYFNSVGERAAGGAPATANGGATNDGATNGEASVVDDVDMIE
ncbi:hypothetical protein DL546_001231 [Coniochaeta pulveracea]|uniref:RRM domain-containing protein n=1 Tax=Coniochaeta pulveracea TaxID=177199 RepID=A0A420XXB4_9PEZI|nr:hypothetical protein DL546_001231 [Coniochaeta pulveracea]